MGLSAGYGAFMGIIDNTPTINIESIVPIGFATNVYDAKGNHTDTLIMAGSNREEAEYEEIPKDLINAFVSIEDERFWQHKGIDTKSILRAVVGILRSDSSAGGGSTLTQQLIKNNVFDGGMEKSWGARIERKLQEQYLALELEKKMSKEMIITNYLNTINLGANTLGVKVAAKRYFNKDISDLTLSECAVVAGITKNPSRLNPITGKEANGERRKIILQKMFEQGYITKEEQESALADDVYDRIQNVNLVTKNQLKSYSYFTDELVEQVLETFIHELGYSETQAHNLLYGGGLSIYTTQDPDLQAIVDEEINNPDYYPEKRYSAEYRLSVEHANGETKHYSEETLRSYHRQILEDGFDGLYDTTQELEDDIAAYRDFILKEGDRVIQETTTVILQPQISFVLMDQATGEVKAINGGRGEKTASLTLNRATNTVKQPGSTFKILSAFAPAIDIKGDTLGTTYYDAPYTIAGKDISNWYSSDNYLGWSNIREGIIYSMNIVAVKTLMDTVTPEVGVSYAKDFGITTLTDTDFNPSTALGGLTKGVTNLELTNAFAAIANEGVYTKPRFFTKIIDHNGKVLVDNQPKTHSVIKESTAFLLTDAMAASLVSSRKFSRGGVSVNSTSTRCRLENMSAAGKSGTTTANNDVWFVGFTPYYSAGIWAGYDKNQKLSSAGGGTSFHKDIWKAIMTRVHEGKEDPGFPVPESVETAVICRKSGKLAIPGVCSNDPRGNATYTEYFAKGTVPTEMCDHHATITVCAESGQLPGAFCTNLTTKVIMIVPKNSGTTDDSHFLTPGACSVHIGPPAETEPGSNELNSEAPPASPTRDYGPHLGPPSSINSPPQLMIPSN